MSYPYPNTPPEFDVQRLAVAPGAMFVSLEEMKLALRADSDDEDISIQRMIGAAADWFEIRCGWVLRPCEFTALVRNISGNRFTVPRGPIREILAVEYWDADADQWAQYTGDEWSFESRGREFDVVLTSASMCRLCRHSPYGYQLRLSFSAGFDGADPGQQTTANGEAEDGMIQCAKTLVALMFQKREEAADSEKDMIVRRYRRFW